ncbi:hypothetical protein MMC30_005643 [Trapelia coarctata]|nr:hypothetical protein [Trapelia coarctata]
MAEALCGPSNPLQSIQKHAGVDRTLQQDRFAFNRPPSESFRSLPAPGAGNLDAEFEAFQAGQPLGGGLQEYHPFQAAGLPAGPSTEQLPSWASDFQRLNLSGARLSPIPSSQFRQEAPLHRSGAGGWHQEFMQQTNRQSPQLTNMNHTYSGAAWQAQSQFQPYSSLDAPTSYLSPIAQEKQPEQRLEDLFDEAAFERAFDAAKIEMTQLESHATSEAQEAKSNVAGKDLEELGEVRNMSQFDYDGFEQGQSIQQPKIGSDAILEESSKQEEDYQPDREADELARTAGQLLENLKHESSAKFQNSTFLALMRQLRDKEVRVEGDRMVDVSTSFI